MHTEDVCLREPTAFSGYSLPESYFHPYYLYKFAIASGVQFLRQIQWYWTANVVGALLWEPRQAFKAGADLEKGKVETFQHFGMNPTNLQEWQIGRTPILALHGKNGSQGMFLKMGEYFERNRLGPLFTVNLSDGELCEEDRDIIDAKIAEIQRVCECEKVDLLGYSRGAEMALYAALEKESYRIYNGYCYQARKWKTWRPEVGKIIRIGSMTTKEEWKHLSHPMQESLWEIRGLDDIHMPEPSFAKHAIEIDGVGHVGLVSSPLVFAVLDSVVTS